MSLRVAVPTLCGIGEARVRGASNPLTGNVVQFRCVCQPTLAVREEADDLKGSSPSVSVCERSEPRTESAVVHTGKAASRAGVSDATSSKKQPNGAATDTTTAGRAVIWVEPPFECLCNSASQRPELAALGRPSEDTLSSAGFRIGDSEQFKASRTGAPSPHTNLLTTRFPSSAIWYDLRFNRRPRQYRSAPVNKCQNGENF